MTVEEYVKIYVLIGALIYALFYTMAAINPKSHAAELDSLGLFIGVVMSICFWPILLYGAFISSRKKR